uniref:TIR domain-containing protein n=1 Tax=Chrysemys picta bellii TaxID=8478 RepID=A0A8C3HEA3_CHRPI
MQGPGTVLPLRQTRRLLRAPRFGGAKKRCPQFPRHGSSPPSGPGSPRAPGSRWLFLSCVSPSQVPMVTVGMTSPSPSRFTYDFSIWYCLRDDDIASCISMMLKKQGLQGYAEHQDQVAGTSVLMTATEVIQASRVAIVILSASSLDDPWCQRVVEWNLHHVIEQEGTKMIPVYVDVEKEQVPLVLRHLNELDYRNKFFEGGTRRVLPCSFGIRGLPWASWWCWQ